MTSRILVGCGNILGIIFLGGGINFFLWFQLEVEIQVGVGCLCRGGRPKKKKAGAGLGGRAQRLPPRCIRRTCCVICLRFVSFLGPWVHNFLFGVLDSYNFWGLRFIKDLVLCSKTCRFLT